MSEIVIHAGAYKTATSTIQTLLTTHRKIFLQRYGLWFPQTGTRRNTGSANPESTAHHPLFHAIRQPAQTTAKSAALRQRLADELDRVRPERAVLCTELLSGTTGQIKRAFLDLLPPGVPVRVVYAIRRPDDYFASLVNQSFKNFKDPDLASDRAPHFARDIRDWQSLLGQDRVTVLTFQSSDYAGFLGRTFAAFGIAPDDPHIDPSLHDNPAMTLRGHLMRSLIRQRLDALGTPLTRILRHKLNLILDDLERSLPKSPKAVFFSERERADLLASNAATMRDVRAMMSEAEASRLAAELARPDSAEARNVTGEVPVDPDVLFQILTALASGPIGKVLALGRQSPEPKEERHAAGRSDAARARRRKRNLS